jgi:hypothetical protein
VLVDGGDISAAQCMEARRGLAQSLLAIQKFTVKPRHASTLSVRVPVLKIYLVPKNPLK